MKEPPKVSEIQQCCEKCYDVYFEKDYPAHTALEGCTNPTCHCHKSKEEKKPRWDACKECREEGNNAFSCFFRHAPDDVKKELLTYVAKEATKSQLETISPTPRGEKSNQGMAQSILPVKLAAPENDSWEDRFTDWDLKNIEPEAIRDRIEYAIDEAYNRGKREERERARKLILQFDQEMTDQNVGDSYFEARNRLMALLEEARNHE